MYRRVNIYLYIYIYISTCLFHSQTGMRVKKISIAMTINAKPLNTVYAAHFSDPDISLLTQNQSHDKYASVY
jgi:hypothetical protein